MLGVPLVSPPPPRPFPSPGAESRLPVSSPCAAGSSSTDIRAAGGRREPSEPEPNPRERAGGRVRRKEAADRGGSSAPATSGLPASPTVGQPQVQPRAATIPPHPRPAPLRRGGRTPQPMDTLVQEWEGVPGDLDCGWTGLGLSPRPLPWAQQVR